MSKGFLKKCLENLKLVAPLMLAGFVVFGLLGLGIWAIFHYTNIIIGFIATYILCTLFGTWLFTSFVYDEDAEKKKSEENDIPNLPFMPNMK